VLPVGCSPPRGSKRAGHWHQHMYMYVCHCLKTVTPRFFCVAELFRVGQPPAAAMAAAGVAGFCDGESWVVTTAEEVEAAAAAAAAEVGSEASSEGGSEGGNYVAAAPGSAAGSQSDAEEVYAEEQEQEQEVRTRMGPVGRGSRRNQGTVVVHGGTGPPRAARVRAQVSDADAEVRWTQVSDADAEVRWGPQAAWPGLFGRWFRAAPPRKVESDSERSESTHVMEEGSGDEAVAEKEALEALEAAANGAPAEPHAAGDEAAVAAVGEEGEAGVGASDGLERVQHSGAGGVERRAASESGEAGAGVVAEEAAEVEVEVEEAAEVEPPQTTTPRALAVIEDDLEAVERSLAELQLRRQRMESGEAGEVC
jgi:hypothetical protein